MGDFTPSSDRLIEEGRRLRDDNRAGGRHRRAVSIGQGARRARQQHMFRRLRNVALALFAIWVATGILGLVIDGIGFAGIMALIVASVVAVGVLGNYPRMRVPSRADINKGDVRQMVARTELWLEHQTPALPPPAARIVADMGVQLDALGLQLEGPALGRPARRIPVVQRVAAVRPAGGQLGALAVKDDSLEIAGGPRLRCSAAAAWRILPDGGPLAPRALLLLPGRSGTAVLDAAHGFGSRPGASCAPLPMAAAATDWDEPLAVAATAWTSAS